MVGGGGVYLSRQWPGERQEGRSRVHHRSHNHTQGTHSHLGNQWHVTSMLSGDHNLSWMICSLFYLSFLWRGVNKKFSFPPHGVTVVQHLKPAGETSSQLNHIIHRLFSHKKEWQNKPFVITHAIQICLIMAWDIYWFHYTSPETYSLSWN